MPRLPITRLLLAVAVMLGASLVGAPARAGSFQVEPVKLTLNANFLTGILAIRNQATEPVRVQVSVFGWKQTLEGEVDLQATKDLVFFPSLLTIAPGESRNVRVSPSPGTKPGAAGEAERTYRVIVEELLPPVKSTEPTVALRVLTRMSVPVFMEPASQKPLPKVDELAVHGKEAKFLLKNEGSVHFMAKAVRLFVAGADGKKLFETNLRGWYVLAGGARSYTVALPAAACARGAGVTVEVETDKETVKQHLDATCSN